MHTDDFEHLTHREWREILRWRAWDAEIALDQAVEARRKAVAKYRAGEAVTLEEWTDLRQALATESNARQKYHNALVNYNSSSASMVSDADACESSPRSGVRFARLCSTHSIIRRPCRNAKIASQTDV